jgi:predicted unusual protein kinase regulating ubiquinone biosynthesis (AarF/ABC1/UbiB family)
MDYAAEGHNAERFRENFKNWSNIHVPKIYWSATTSKVLTMEFIHGTKVIDLEEQHRLNVSPAKVNRPAHKDVPQAASGGRILSRGPTSRKSACHA